MGPEMHLDIKTLTVAGLRGVCALRNMMFEMERKGLDLVRLTKTSTILLSCGVSKSSLPKEVLHRCFAEQQSDGGWVSVVDTIWNMAYLVRCGVPIHSEPVQRGLSFLRNQRNGDGLWGRSKRDRSRIPVSGLMLFFFPELASREDIGRLETLWTAEQNSLTYKAAYFLLAISQLRPSDLNSELIERTVYWLIANQREDGGFAPWKSHPIASDVFCTSVSILALVRFRHFGPAIDSALAKAASWLVANQLPAGIWRYHEIEHGAAWGVWAIHESLGIGTHGANLWHR